MSFIAMKRKNFKAIIEEIKRLHTKGQPVLVGTISIDKSERLAKVLSREGIKHSVLNAKNHQLEAEIVAQAGQKGVVTISTNMAGRGTDIVLGEGVTELGGLHILGTERHESRRIDNQLRGRSGRQGDQGSSRFYLSLEDDLLRIFGSDRISGLMGKMGMEEGEPIEHSLISKAIENAQRRVEGHNFEIRKHLIEYDDVMNQQREVIYGQRRKGPGRSGIAGNDPGNDPGFDGRDYGGAFLNEKVPPKNGTLNPCPTSSFNNFPLKISVNRNGAVPGAGGFERTAPGTGLVRLSEKSGGHRTGGHGLSGADGHAGDDRYTWKDHLLSMDHLKEGIGLTGLWAAGPLAGISAGRL